LSVFIDFFRWLAYLHGKYKTDFTAVQISRKGKSVMLKNIKIGYRLGLGFGLMLVFMVAIIVVSLYHGQTMYEKLNRIVKINNARLHLANEMLDDIREAKIAIRELMLAKYGHVSDNRIRDDVARYMEIIKRYDTSYEEIKKLIPENDTEGLAFLSKLKISEATTLAMEKKVIDLSVAGKLKEAIDFIHEEASPDLQWIRDMEDFMKYNEKLTILRYNQAEASAHSARTVIFVLGLVALVLSLLSVILLSLNVTRPLKTTVDAANQIASGDLTADLSSIENRGDELGSLAKAFSKMVAALKHNRDSVQKQDWLKTGIARLNRVMSGDPELTALASKVISEICTYLEAHVGTIYLAGNGGDATLSLVGSYAYRKRKDLPDVFKMGEGLIGQAALEKQQILVKNVPEDYIRISSGLGERIPRFICVTPFVNEGRVKGVVEIGILYEMGDQQMEYLQQAMAVLAVAIESAQGRTNLSRSLEEAQSLSAELQVQQEELKTTNEELETQTRSLQMSEEKLKTQQEELQVTNEELEEKNELLDRQKRDVEKARKDLEKKAEDLAIASKYKSEFLANMSHELRTPLNSLLLLSQTLFENKNGNLSSEQVESAGIIQSSGNDLLNLINEILDLSKIEAGRMSLQLGTVQTSDIAESVRASFGHMADKKGLRLEVSIRNDAPTGLTSDRKRIEQIVRNLISNAIKFTDSGGVTVTFARPALDANLSESGLSAGESLSIEVKDTGIGIAPENQKIIFEAFQQVDGGTARKYGGTGLGLSISREISRLLGGEIKLDSKLGKGSAFTLYLPVKPHSDHKAAPVNAAANTIGDNKNGNAVRNTKRHNAATVQTVDDRSNLKKEDKVILVIEDDPNFAKLLYKKCHEKNFRCLVSPTGEEGLELAIKYLPSAVILDISLPGMNGWSVLDALKENTGTRHIPVHIASAEESSSESVRKGAVGHATKPLSQKDLEDAFRRLEQVSDGKPKCVLVVDDNPEIRRSTVKLISDDGVKVEEVENGKQALVSLRSGHYDCMILDLGLPDMDGLKLLERVELEGIKMPPVIVYTSRDLTMDEEIKLREHAEAVVIKDVRSQERLLDEVSLFLHRVVSKMPEKQRKIIRDLHSTDELLRDRKVLIVDDDMRTAFAMSRLLSDCGMQTLKAENGDKALRLLEENQDVDIVLMDIMMPIMDGYEAMKRIRSQERLRRLPIIVLTAKAMPEDREKCLTAGANDYLSKPVDQKRLLSMMRVWLCR
jgi:CheY-like chemotaxis protein/signal transduction histidine kinase/HAMP domain-containing protein